MFNIGPGELVAILIVALIVLGPNRLPEAVRTVGRVVGELRRISSGFQEELRSALDDSDIIEPVTPATAATSTTIDTPTADTAVIDTSAAGLTADLGEESSAEGADGAEQAVAPDMSSQTDTPPEPPDADDQRAAS